NAAWANSPAWSLQEQSYDGRALLVLTGGADETYIVDEATSKSCISRVLEAWQSNTLSSLLDDAECSAAVKQIQRVGALVPGAALHMLRRYSVVWLGDICTDLLPALDTMLAEQCASANPIQYTNDPS